MIKWGKAKAMVPTQAQNELDHIPEEHRSKFTLDNNGNLVFKNRAYRRDKQPSNNWYTKNTHSIRKKRNAKSKHHR